jgi:hypothetical protein
MRGVTPPVPHVPSMSCIGANSPSLNFILTYVNIVRSPVMFKSQPTFHFIYFLPYLHYASLLTFIALLYFNCNTYRTAKSTERNGPMHSCGHSERQFSHSSGNLHHIQWVTFICNIITCLIHSYIHRIMVIIVRTERINEYTTPFVSSAPFPYLTP